jgi:hypothetical protein
VIPLPEEARALLGNGTIARLAVSRSTGPHLTPLVYSFSDDRIWVTTSRSSVKARAWRNDPRVAGLVRDGVRSVSFVGLVTRHDLLDPETWADSIPRTKEVLRAAAAFTRRNARFFAGYAVDARNVPLAWTPPGRLFAEIETTRGLVVEDAIVSSRWGRWGRSRGPLSSSTTYRASAARTPPLRGVPKDVAARLGSHGPGALAIKGSSLAALPVSWAIEGGAVLVAMPSSLLRFAGASRRTTAALEIDGGSAWRAREMVGGLVAGTTELFDPQELSSGRASALRTLERIRTAEGEDTLVRISPERVTWWEGWTSGTVARR